MGELTIDLEAEVALRQPWFNCIKHGTTDTNGAYWKQNHSTNLQ